MDTDDSDAYATADEEDTVIRRPKKHGKRCVPLRGWSFCHRT
jgi:hypothetical protein